jgi:hypothetical protein
VLLASVRRYDFESQLVLHKLTVPKCQTGCWCYGLGQNSDVLF